MHNKSFILTAYRESNSLPYFINSPEPADIHFGTETLPGEHEIREIFFMECPTSSRGVSASVHLTRRCILDSDRTTCQKPDSKLSYNFQWESFSISTSNQTLHT
ncbi:hypothetical protein J6590_085744 [Homalodisca vitripennis]|nr:hypothetical protein J6590_085744 [Homalodisca vitripennis]